jgi:large conductance mechanosensitive channel
MNLKGLWAEFKAFAFKGNMIELAVAVVIGAAFSTVINSLVTDVIMPSVGYVVNTATTAAVKAKDAAENVAAKTGIASSQPTTDASAPAAGAAAAPAAPAAPAATPSPTAPVNIKLMIGPVNAGAFIGALINFLLVAGAVFLVIVKLLGSVMKKVTKAPEPSAPVTKECPKCYSIIAIKATKCPNCTADLPAVVP